MSAYIEIDITPLLFAELSDAQFDAAVSAYAEALYATVTYG